MTPPRNELVLATNNPGKLKEYRQILGEFDVHVHSPSDLGLSLTASEDGETFIENARIKALALGPDTGYRVIGDDSGLEVDALGGQPGVHSHRFGYKRTDAARTDHLLTLMSESPDSSRAARFRCAITVVYEGEVTFETERACEGRIGAAPRGCHGFGYDPVFVPEGHTQTFGESGDEIKNRISHRALASGDLLEYLRALIE